MSKKHSTYSGAICSHCDANKSSHRRTWWRYSKAVVYRSLSTVLPASLSKLIMKIREHSARISIEFFNNRKNFVRSSDIAIIPFPRARALFIEAHKRGIVMEAHTYRGAPLHYYRATFPNKRVIGFFGLPRPPETRFRGEIWMDDKILLKKKLSAHGVPVPIGASVTTFRSARRLFEKLQTPFVVKPRRGSRGSHTTTCIYTEKDLYEAFKIAKQLCYFVVLEEQIHGAVYRGTVINGKLVGVLAGVPPRITGDGVHSISQLIKQKNDMRGPLTAEVAISIPLLQFLSRNRFSLNSVLPAGTILDLSQKIGFRNGGVSEECTVHVHPELTKILEEAARIVDDPIIGFDFIVPDATQDPRTQRWGIIEANSSPFIHMHNDPELGTNNNVAQYVWDLWQ